MPYDEFEDQAWMYYNNAKDKYDSGNKDSALRDFNMARAIAVKNDMYGLISLIDSYLEEY